MIFPFLIVVRPIPNVGSLPFLEQRLAAGFDVSVQDAVLPYNMLSALLMRRSRVSPKVWGAVQQMSKKTGPARISALSFAADMEEKCSGKEQDRRMRFRDNASLFLLVHK